jgi:hypothetical protein
MKKYPFRSVAELETLIESYFDGLILKDKTQPDAKKQRREPTPPTISGLAYHLGFESIEAFDACRKKGKYTFWLNRAKLRVLAEYETKLHFQSSTGAIFAIKNMTSGEQQTNTSNEATNNIFNVEVIHSGLKVAGAEKEVTL